MPSHNEERDPKRLLSNHTSSLAILRHPVQNTSFDSIAVCQGSRPAFTVALEPLPNDSSGACSWARRRVGIFTDRCRVFPTGRICLTVLMIIIDDTQTHDLISRMTETFADHAS
jgi:hypothetical protein